MTASSRLAEFATGLRLEDVPADTREAAKLHALDALGCGLAAHALGEGAFVHAAAAEAATAGPATAIGVPGGLPAGQAALLNGTLCHLLDFDDTHPDSVVHVSPAVLERLRSLNALGVSPARGRPPMHLSDVCTARRPNGSPPARAWRNGRPRARASARGQEGRRPRGGRAMPASCRPAGGRPGALAAERTVRGGTCVCVHSCCTPTAGPTYYRAKTG
ncbi:MAG TPA: MmgE/PrpD family protein [Solirubrobacteraceae bacterium]|jgi:hypothetical protein